MQEPFRPQCLDLDQGSVLALGHVKALQMEFEMNLLGLLFGIAIALSGHDAFAKNRLTDPIKIARECKSDMELMCKGFRPGGQRIIRCLQQRVIELSSACSVALKSTE